MSIVLQGSTSGSVTLQEPAIAGSTVLNLPATSGTILTTASSGQVIPSGALPVGSVLQVVNGVSNYVTTTSASYVDTGLTATITPKFSTSKILVLVNLVGITAPNASWDFALTNSAGTVLSYLINYNSSGGQLSSGSSFLFSPATTSATTYKVQFKVAGGNTLRIGDYAANQQSSTITLMEIAA